MMKLFGRIFFFCINQRYVLFSNYLLIILSFLVMILVSICFLFVQEINVMLICCCLRIFSGYSLHFKKFWWLFTFNKNSCLFYHYVLIQKKFVQEFVLEDDFANEAFGPLDCVPGLDTPFIASFFVPNAQLLLMLLFLVQRDPLLLFFFLV